MFSIKRKILFQEIVVLFPLPKVASSASSISGESCTSLNNFLLRIVSTVMFDACVRPSIRWALTQTQLLERGWAAYFGNQIHPISKETSLTSPPCACLSRSWLVVLVRHSFRNIYLFNFFIGPMRCKSYVSAFHTLFLLKHVAINKFLQHFSVSLRIAAFS